MIEVPSGGARVGRGPVRGVVLWLPVASAVGCLPTARIVAHRFRREGDVPLPRGAGGHAVYHALGLRPAIATALIDISKGYAVARLARHFGASRDLTGALALTAMVARVVVLGGRGAATGTGAAFAIDETSAAVAAIPAAAGVVTRHQALGVALTAVAYVSVRWAFDRSPRAALWGLLLCCVGAWGRLRGDASVVPEGLTWRIAWNRLWYDNDDGPRRR